MCFVIQNITVYLSTFYRPYLARNPTITLAVNLVDDLQLKLPMLKTATDLCLLKLFSFLLKSM